MTFDKLYAIQYPAGSFGHFTHLIISNFGNNFVKSDDVVNFKNKKESGSSHFTSSMIKKYYCIDEYKDYVSADLVSDYTRLTKNNQFVTVIIDSGIADDSIEFLQFFPGAKHIRITYDDYSWPFSAKAFYTRCMAEVLHKKTSISQFIEPDADRWNSNDPWEQREKYFLFLKEHPFREYWRDLNNCTNINVDKYLSYNELATALSFSCIGDFEEVYDQFFKANKTHIEWYLECRRVLEALKNKENISLSNINDLFSQATINYYIYIIYNFEVPAWDYRDWFVNTTDIFDLLEKNNIIIN